MALIGITGKIGSGKTTATDYLTSLGYHEYSFAGPLKQIAEIFHFEFHQLYGTQEQKLEVNAHWNVSGRHFLQKFGTEICRNVLPKVLPEMKLDDTSLWIRLFEIERAKNPDRLYVVSDVRFPDEAQAIKRMGGIIIRLVRPSPHASSHASETVQDLIEPDVTINNTSTKTHLYRELVRSFTDSSRGPAL